MIMCTIPGKKEEKWTSSDVTGKYRVKIIASVFLDGNLVAWLKRESF